MDTQQINVLEQNLRTTMVRVNNIEKDLKKILDSAKMFEAILSDVQTKGFYLDENGQFQIYDGVGH